MAAERGTTPARKEVLLYLYPRRTVFIDRDVRALSSRYEVHTHELLRGPTWSLPVRLVAQALFLLLHRAGRRTIICHFAGYHSVLPAMVGRRTLIILAGSDCASFPNIGYGNFRKRLYGAATAYSVRHAAMLLPVHGSLMRMSAAYDPAAPVEQGITAHVKELSTPYKAVPYGFDPGFWQATTTTRDPGMCVCVASGALPGDHTHFRKGVDLILEAAHLAPTMTFHIVGSPEPERYRALPENVTVHGPVDGSTLRDFFSRASFVLQVSVMEGFPNALCEAMLCGCIPVVSAMAAMPDIVEGIGEVVQRRTGQDLAKALLRVASLSAAQRVDLSQAARARIAERYSEAARMQGIREAITGGSGGAGRADGP